MPYRDPAVTQFGPKELLEYLYGILGASPDDDTRRLVSSTTRAWLEAKKKGYFLRFRGESDIDVTKALIDFALHIGLSEEAILAALDET